MYRNGYISEATEVKCPFHSIDVLDNVKSTVSPSLVFGRQSTHAMVAIHLPSHIHHQFVSTVLGLLSPDSSDMHLKGE